MAQSFPGGFQGVFVWLPMSGLCSALPGLSKPPSTEKKTCTNRSKGFAGERLVKLGPPWDHRPH